MPKLVKKYLCVVCRKKEIVQSMVEHVFEDDVPDVSNCDFSTYSDHKISGGRLLAKRPALNWKISYSEQNSEPQSDIPGGICDECLANDRTISSLMIGGHIDFVDEKNLKNFSKW